MLVAALTIAVGSAAVLLAEAPAAAHVVPSTTIELDVHDDDITATVTPPADDLATASGIDATGGGIDEDTAASITDYLGAHFDVTPHGRMWEIGFGDVAPARTRQWGTRTSPPVIVEAPLTPAHADDLRTFTLGYDAIIHQVVTADIFAILNSDWASGEFGSAWGLGTVAIDTATGRVAPLQVALDEGGLCQGFASMLALGTAHVAEGTDHQLFLLTLLLPAPLVAVERR
ncbi:hypothetical protein GCM10023405_00540 [Streptomonospora salina]